MEKQVSFELTKKINIIKDLGFDLDKDSVIMDFGCGSGKMVQELCGLGYKAYGIETRMTKEENVDTEGMVKKGIIRTIDFDNYVLPFEDNTFDFIYSHSVFEHVSNYEESISEIARVLKPGGFCLHCFPSKFRPVEPHIFVPFSSLIQSHWWIHVWVSLGIHNEWEDCQSADERADRYYNYIKQETNYLTRKELSESFKIKFKDVKFCEDLFNKYSPRRGKYLYQLAKIFPFVPVLFSTFHTRVIFTSSPLKNGQAGFNMN